MSLFEQVALKYFDVDQDGCLNDRERSELERVNRLNDLSLPEFLALPDTIREAAEELWTAHVFDLNVRHQVEQSRKFRKELAKYRPEFR